MGSRCKEAMFQICFAALLVSTVSGVVEISDFYSYGINASDSTLSSQDDASTRVPISFDYPFFGSTYQEVHISTNGIISFGSGDNSYVPRPFPLTNMRTVAIYWTDSNPARGGTVFYRETTNVNVLQKISQEIKNRLISYNTFKAEWALIVTFDRVRPYGCGCNNTCLRNVTHQTILTSDGVNSFAIFNFNELGYSTGSNGCGNFAQVGFNAGDGKRFFLMPSSNTIKVPDIALFSSNVGVPGKWIFSTDANDIIEQCNTKGQLDIFPRKVLYFGGNEIQISGVCYDQNSFNVSVMFDDVSVKCYFGEWKNLQCRVPFLKKVGKISVSLIYNSIQYKSFIISVGRDDNTVVENINKILSETYINKNFTVEWDTIDLQQSIEFTGHQIDYYIDNLGNIIAEDIVALQYGKYTNNGKVSLSPVKTPKRQQFIQYPLIRSFFLSGSLTSTSAIATMIIITDRTTATMHCNNWHTSQPTRSEMISIVNDLTLRRPCLPGIPLSFPERIDNYVIDERCNTKILKNKLMCELYHNGAKGCYRRTKNEGSPVVQCCYSHDRSIMLGNPSGGTISFSDLEISTIDHLKKDLLPRLTCCKIGDNQCDKYYEKRPSINPGIIIPVTTVTARGDPHFITLDGTSYSFNPVGEFIYMTTLDGADIIQTRISQYIDENGKPKQASIFSGFVIKGKNSDNIQVELSSKQNFAFTINRKPMRLDVGFWEFDGISVDIENNSTVVVQTNSGIRLEIIALNKALHVILSLSDAFKNRISGLIGDWDNNSSNDLKLPNGTFISANSSNYIIHYNFGMLWTTTNETSLFTYPNGLSWSDYQVPSFRPDFSVPVDNPQCNGNKDCNYDIQVTGNVNFGLGNIVILKRTADLKEMYKNISHTCPSNINVQNGNVKVNVNELKTHYSLTCRKGFKVFGKSSSDCVSGSYTPIGSCDYSSSSNKKLGIAISLLIGCLIYINILKLSY